MYYVRRVGPIRRRSQLLAGQVERSRTAVA